MAREEAFAPFVRATFITPVLVFVHFVALAAFCLVAVRVVQQYALLFADMDAELAGAAVGVVVLSNWMCHNWWTLFVALIMFDAPLLFALQVLPPRLRWTYHVWFTGVTLALLVGIIWISFVITAQFSDMPVPGG